MSDSLRPHGLYSPWNSPGQNAGMGSLSFSRGSSQLRSPALQADSLPAEPQWTPKNTAVGSLSLLQGIFPIQESNQGLLHGRQILYRLSYQWSPLTMTTGSNLITVLFLAYLDWDKPEVHQLTCPNPSWGTEKPGVSGQGKCAPPQLTQKAEAFILTL